MEELAKLEQERGNAAYMDLGERGRQGERGKQGVRRVRAASNEMCTFLVLNISSLQLIPVNVIAYRAQYGSVAPTAVLAPGLVATMFSTVVAVVFCKAMARKHPAPQKK